MPLEILCPNPDCDVVALAVVRKPDKRPECGTLFEEERAMTELMLRLIKDGKIVGYQWHTDTLSKGIILIHFSKNLSGETWKDWRKIDYDSFDLGIKVGEEWWFSGDILEGNDDMGDYCKVTLIYDRGCLLIPVSCMDGSDYSDLDTAFDYGYHLERIGTIYDKKQL